MAKKAVQNQPDFCTDISRSMAEILGKKSNLLLVLSIVFAVIFYIVPADKWSNFNDVHKTWHPYTADLLADKFEQVRIVMIMLPLLYQLQWFERIITCGLLFLVIICNARLNKSLFALVSFTGLLFLKMVNDTNRTVLVFIALGVFYLSM